MHDIQQIHKGEDYTTYSYKDEVGNMYEVEVTGIAQKIIDTLGKALYKKSFIKK